MSTETPAPEQERAEARRKRPARPGWPGSRRASAGPEAALNIADLGHQDNLRSDDWDEFHRRLSQVCNDACARLSRQLLDRIYVGSYFCDRFFLSLDGGFYESLARFCGTYGLKATLVVPLFGQSTLKAGKARVEKLVALRGDDGPLFDEVVANDPAAALFLGELAGGRPGDGQTADEGEPDAAGGKRPLRIVYGRMMAKSSRDPRHDVMADAPQPYALDAQQAAELAARFGYSMAECDPTAPVVDASAFGDALPLAVHAPHCLMTTGHICQQASLDLPRDRKFRADAPCRQECLRGVQVYEHHSYDSGEPRWFTRAGRTVYFENPAFELEGARAARIVWTPSDFLCGRADDTWQPQADGTWQQDPAQPAWEWAYEEGGAQWE